MITTSYIYNRKKTARAGVPGAVEIRITDRRKSWYISTGVKVLKSEWLEGSVVNRNDAAMLNRRLANMIGIVGQEIDDCILKQSPLDVDAIKARLSMDVTCNDERLPDWIEGELPLLDVTAGTRAHYLTLTRRLREYGGIIFWRDVTAENVYRFNDWLHTLTCPLSDAKGRAGQQEARLSVGAVYNYHKCLKAMLARAVRLGKIESNPYDRLRGEFKKGDNARLEYLTEDEMRAFEALHPVEGSQLAVVRDLFVWQMHTRMSFGDTQVFDFSQCREHGGRLALVGRRVKTGVEYVVMFDDECMNILRRYGSSLPRITNQEYNVQLKVLGTVAGIRKSLHSHLARHTFATYMLSHKAELSNVSKMLGHTNTLQTQRYAKVLPESVFSDFEKVFISNKKNN